jgi:hypothetical protein
MRIRSGFVGIAACLLVGQFALIANPEVASAEWTEASFPCDVGPGAILPLPVTWYQLGEAVMPNVGYFTYGDTATPPAASDFTASASWGDGTTSPATVKPASVGDCYEVSTPSHAYSVTGAFPFSYTVHDISTGLDHKLGATEFHSYTWAPSLIGEAASRIINPEVGAPWSGVVGEFSYDAPSRPNYTAQIEWGDAQPPSAGTIGPGSGANTFTVSGSVTYRAPADGTATVVLSLAFPTGRWAINSAEVRVPAPDIGPAPVRLRYQPILAVIPRRGAAPAYEFAFRTNRVLPQNRAGHVEAAIEAYGRLDPVSDLIPHRATTCYVARAAGIAGRHVKPAARTPFRLTIEASSIGRQSDHAVLRHFANLDRMRSVAVRALGCG